MGTLCRLPLENFGLLYCPMHACVSSCAAGSCQIRLARITNIKKKKNFILSKREYNNNKKKKKDTYHGWATLDGVE